MLSGLWSLVLVSIINGITLLVSYISHNAFPDPLSEAEENHYIEEMLKGDPKAKSILAEHNLRLVAHIVKKFNLSHEKTDDLISIGTIGLLKGINSFKPNKGTKLATYAAKCIENEILMYLRQSKKTRSEVYLQDAVGKDKKGNEITLIEVINPLQESVTDIAEQHLEYKELLQKINRLCYREKKVLLLRFGILDGIPQTQKQVAKELNISRSYVSRLEKKAIKNLNKILKSKKNS